MSKKLIPLSMWAERRYERPPSARTLRRWVEAGNIFPRPRKEGRTIYVSENAIYVDLSNPDHLSEIAEVLNESTSQ